MSYISSKNEVSVPWISGGKDVDNSENLSFCDETTDPTDDTDELVGDEDCNDISSLDDGNNAICPCDNGVKCIVGDCLLVGSSDDIGTDAGVDTDEGFVRNEYNEVSSLDIFHGANCVGDDCNEECSWDDRDGDDSGCILLRCVRS